MNLLQESAREHLGYDTAPGLGQVGPGRADAQGSRISKGLGPTGVTRRADIGWQRPATGDGLALICRADQAMYCAIAVGGGMAVIH
jgi:hypothetical protein